MEVIRHGNTYKEIECKKCGALLSYYTADVKVSSNCEEYFGEIHSSCKKYITCPECKKEIVLSFRIDGKETVK